MEESQLSRLPNLSTRGEVRSKVITLADDVVLWGVTPLSLLVFGLGLASDGLSALRLLHIVAALLGTGVSAGRQWLPVQTRGHLYTWWIYGLSLIALWLFGPRLGVGAMLIISCIFAVIVAGRGAFVAQVLGILPVVFLFPVLAGEPLAFSDNLRTALSASIAAACGGIFTDYVLQQMNKAQQVALTALEEAGRARQNEAMARLAAGVAHDVNNSLTVVLGNSSYLHKHCTDDTSREMLEDVISATQSARDIVRQLMLLGHRTPVGSEADLGQTLTQLVRSLERLLPEHIDVQLSTVPGLVVPIPRAEAERVVLNLCLNARDAMPEGGVLTLELSRSGPRTCQLVVADTGSGMSIEVRERLFEPFYTTKQGKAGRRGLGLASVLATVEGAGGSISVSSILGEGTRFTLDLPLVEPASTTAVEAAATEPRVAPPTAPAGARVLLVEDAPAVLRATRRLLEESGYHVDEASEESAAMAVLEGARPFDLLLTDGVMPRTDTQRLIESFRRHSTDAPVIVVSGWLLDSLPALSEPWVSFLDKPFDPEDLLSLVYQRITDARG